ncbi:hypothetical protein [Nocardia higoensis]|uniref:hypothetical protein n=1 Tax=Nocardia higoensis TaxID=228599 RepID=UPI000305C225|nr:hypothetical protein [Nocardia higoensis]
MTRLAGAIDRLIAALVGVVLLALGAALLLWNTAVGDSFPDTVTAPGLVTATTTGWWPWALAGTGLLCALVAIRWLFSHTPAAAAGTLRLGDTDGLGGIAIDLGPVADAVAAHLAARPEVFSAKGKAVVERGVRTIELTVTAVSIDDMEPLVGVADDTSAELAGSLGDPSVAVRTVLGLSSKRGSSARHVE